VSGRSLAGAAAAVTATALVGGRASSGDNRWFQSLRKPSFQPPPVAFPIVWTALYASIAAAGADAVDHLEDAERTEFQAALAANLALNASWTWVFFRARRPWLATAVSGVLAGSSADLVRRARPASGRAAALLVPYTAWCSFATVLAGRIAWLNRGRPR
jgi:benzodiazapine receptor